ncbi:MAG: branched-chain amino acid ABC transporter permease [Candidatus Caldarchaeum sp.]
MITVTRSFQLRHGLVLIISILLGFVVSSVVAFYQVVQVMGSSPLLFAQLVVSGVMMGGIYGLAATGLTIIFGVMKIINLNHGEIITLGGFVTLWLSLYLGVEPLLVIPLSFIVLMLLGMGLQTSLFNSVIKYGLNPPVFIAFALALGMQNLMIIMWTADVRIIRTNLSAIELSVGEVSLQSARFIAFLLAIVLTIVMKFMLDRTMTGKALRAISQNSEAALLMGIDVSRVNILAYGLGSGLAAVAGALLGMVFSVSPLDGPVLTSKTIAIIVLGGMGNIVGALVAGLMLGLIESYVGYIMGSGFINAVALLIFLVVLLVRPSGLFGER